LTRHLSDGGRYQRCRPVLCSAVSMISAGQRIYVADVHPSCHRILSINVENNQFSDDAVIGTGERGLRDGPIAKAQFSSPRSMACDDDGNIFIADVGNHCIRFVKKGIVRTLSQVGSASSVAPMPLYVDSPVHLALDTDRGLLFVVEGTDLSQLKVIRGLPGHLESYLSPLEIPISEYGEKIVIPTAGSSLVLHKAMLNLRCPGLVGVDLSQFDLHHAVANSFTQFINSETIPVRPPSGISPEQFYTSLAVRSQAPPPFLRIPKYCSPNFYFITDFRVAVQS
jgi:hypothetical protein